jgi:SlyX protein
MSSDERLTRLEEKLAYLERHVTEQDKAMLELGDEVARLRLELRTLRDGPAPETRGALPGDDAADERPPHY